MGKQLVDVKMKIRAALKAVGKYDKSQEFLIDIAAGYAVAHKKLLQDIEVLESAVLRDGEELDFVSSLDESIKVLPSVSDNYHRALAALGLGGITQESTGSVQSSVNNFVSDKDAVAALIKKVTNL